MLPPSVSAFFRGSRISRLSFLSTLRNSGPRFGPSVTQTTLLVPSDQAAPIGVPLALAKSASRRVGRSVA